MYDNHSCGASVGRVERDLHGKSGIEVVIAVDASNSMMAPIDAEHLGSQRMRTAKLMLERLIDRLDNDRVGLVVYAGNAHTLIPVTSDFLSANHSSTPLIHNK